MRTLFNDYKNVKDFLQIRVFDSNLHPEYFANRVCSRDWLPLCAYFAIPLRVVDDKVVNVVITDELIRGWSVDEYILYKDAMKNAMTQGPAIRSLYEDDILEMLCISAFNYEFGSSYILNPKVRKEMGGNYIIIPSSIHELIAVKDVEDLDMIPGMYDMVRETNANPDLITEGDILSNKLFWCSRDGRFIEELKEHYGR